MDCLIDLISFIDISTQLSSTIPLFSNDLLSLDSSISSINIPFKSCNNNNYTIFDLSRFNLLESVEIGDECFESVKTFYIDGLSQLKTIKIGKKSFTQNKNSLEYDESKSFHILNCESLESIQIGERSFSDFGGEFELDNLPQLQSIQIGTIGSNSYSFLGSSFVIRGIELILDIERLDLPKLQSVNLGKRTFNYSEIYCLCNLNSLEALEIGDFSFKSVNTFRIDGLNGLKTIRIGKNSFTQLENVDDDSKSFHILNCESLESIQIGKYGFSDFAGEFELKNLPQLQFIQFGFDENSAHNFCYSSFVIRGIELILKI